MNLESIKYYLQSLGYREFVRVLLMYILCCTGIIGFMMYRHFSVVNDMRKKVHTLNKARREVQEILTEYERIKSKQNDVDQLLAKDKGFYIQKYYQDTIATLNIVNQNVSNLRSQTWPNGYIEDSVEVNLLQITMKQLCEFLQALQKNPRVFVKRLEITKANIDKKIHVNILIATLKLVADKTGK